MCLNEGNELRIVLSLALAAHDTMGVGYKPRLGDEVIWGGHSAIPDSIWKGD
jgi:hypothetical protein